MSKRDKWSVGKVYHANAGELRDGVLLIAKNGRPHKVRSPFVLIEARFFGQIIKVWKAAQRKERAK